MGALRLAPAGARPGRSASALRGTCRGVRGGRHRLRLLRAGPAAEGFCPPVRVLRPTRAARAVARRGWAAGGDVPATAAFGVLATVYPRLRIVLPATTPQPSSPDGGLLARFPNLFLATNGGRKSDSASPANCRTRRRWSEPSKAARSCSRVGARPSPRLGRSKPGGPLRRAVAATGRTSVGAPRSGCSSAPARNRRGCALPRSLRGDTMQILFASSEVARLPRPEGWPTSPARCPKALKILGHDIRDRAAQVSNGGSH